METMNLLKFARLIKKQTDRVYFSDIPVGTMFIIVGEIETPSYDLLGHFVGYPPQILMDGEYHYLGYIEKGSWEIVTNGEEILKYLRHEQI